MPYRKFQTAVIRDRRAYVWLDDFSDWAMSFGTHEIPKEMWKTDVRALNAKFLVPFSLSYEEQRRVFLTLASSVSCTRKKNQTPQEITAKFDASAPWVSMWPRADSVAPRWHARTGRRGQVHTGTLCSASSRIAGHMQMHKHPPTVNNRFSYIYAQELKFQVLFWRDVLLAKFEILWLHFASEMQVLVQENTMMKHFMSLLCVPENLGTGKKFRSSPSCKLVVVQMICMFLALSANQMPKCCVIWRRFALTYMCSWPWI